MSVWGRRGLQYGCSFQCEYVRRVSPLPVGGIGLVLTARGCACRRDPGKVCRNFLAGLVLLPGLEVWALSGALRGRRPGSKRCLARSDSRHPLPGSRRHACGGVGSGKKMDMPRSAGLVGLRIGSAKGWLPAGIPATIFYQSSDNFALRPQFKVWALLRRARGENSF